jgi:Bifunctional DNA primase/polymerase, N-terminal/Primase C terminal 2 (PriCT-2)
MQIAKADHQAETETVNWGARQMKNKTLDTALALRKKYGWKLFPARMEGGKKWSWLWAGHALGQDLNWGMSDDPEQLRKNFSRPRWCDRCGLGVPTGAVNKIFVIEADTVTGHGVDGLAALRKLEREHSKLPKTLMAVSPSGSVHRYYKHPGNGMMIKSAALVHGVDIKGDGGMVIAPPSRRGDGVDRWRNSLPIVAAPAWLLDMVQETERVPSESSDYFVRFGKSTRQVSMNELTLAVAMIPNADISWDPDKNTGTPGWNAIGMAIYDASDGSAEGFRLFDAFSQRSSKYNAKTTRDKWKAFHKCPPRKISAGTVFHLAKEAEPDWKSRICSRDPKVIKLLKEFHKLLGEPS